MLFIGCDEEDSSPPANPFIWRSNHSSVALNNAIYVIGGDTRNEPGDPLTTLNDVWKSTDGGRNWVEVTRQTPDGKKIPSRRSHISVALGSAIYVIGGYDFGGTYFDDVWESTDGGKSWNEVTVTSRFPARHLHSSAVLGNAIYVMGGSDGRTTFNDVWESTDNGKNWTQVARTRFSPSRYHSSVVLDNAIYVIGGYNGRRNFFNDVWKSTDNGVTWIEVTRATIPKFPAREGHSSVVLNNTIYVIGGKVGSAIVSTVWESEDGVEWKQVASRVPFAARYEHSSVVLGGTMVVMGGESVGHKFNDVWKSRDGKSWVRVNKGTDN